MNYSHQENWNKIKINLIDIKSFKGSSSEDLKSKLIDCVSPVTALFLNTIWRENINVTLNLSTDLVNQYSGLTEHSKV